MQNIEALGNAGAAIMMRGAVDFLRSRGLTSADVDLDALVVELRKRSRAAVDEALADAKVALEEPAMDQVAEATFAASMKLAGIEAAKAVIAVHSK